jgi:hypothetical protein
MRNFVLFVLDNGSLLFLGAAAVALIFGNGFGAAMYWSRGGGVGPRRALKRIDLVAHMFSLAAVMAAMMPLYNLTGEFLLKVALHDKQTELEKNTSDNIRIIHNFCWAKQPDEIQQDCKNNIFPMTDLMSGLNYEVDNQSLSSYLWMCCQVISKTERYR